MIPDQTTHDQTTQENLPPASDPAVTAVQTELQVKSDPTPAEDNVSNPGGADNGVGAGEKPRARTKPRTGRRSSGSAAGADSAPAADPRSVKDQLLAPVQIPQVTLDRRVLPAKLLAALDSAGLGAREMLPAATLMALAAVSAIGGPSVRCEPRGDLRNLLGNVSDTALRVALVRPDHSGSLVPSAILAAAYAAENDALDRYEAADQVELERLRAAAGRRRLHAQASEIAAALATPPPPPLIEVMPARSGVRPRIVVINEASAAVRAAAAGATGVLLIDQRRMPSMTRIGGFYDTETELLLAALARGDSVPIADPKSGRTQMRSLPASVIGGLIPTDFLLAHEVAAESLLATAFVPLSAPLPPTGDSTDMVSLLRPLGDLAGNVAVTLMFAASVETLTTAAERWTTLAAAAQPPLSSYLAHLPDLARRLAAALHLVTRSGGDGKLAREIPATIVKSAVALVDSLLLPTAQAILSPVSTTDAIRDGRRIIDYVRAKTSPRDSLERRRLLQSWQHSMPTVRLNAALTLLEAEKLLTATEKSGSKQYQVSADVYE